MSARRYRVAIVGFGIGKLHLEGFRALPEQYEVAAVVDLDAARRAEAAGTHGVPETPAAIEAVLGRRDIDIVDICTPPGTHLSLAEAALAAGHHVICEKPLVGSLADCDRLGAAAQAARGVLMPIFQYRYGNGIRRLRHLVEAGVCGRLYLATAETAWRRGADYYAVPWRGRFATELGGCLTTHAIHAHDLLRWIAGDYTEVFARTATRVNAIEVEDCASISARFTDGGLAAMGVTLGSTPEISRLRFCFEHLTAESGLSPYAPGNDPWTITPADAAAEGRIARALRDFEELPERFAGQFLALHRALEQGREPPVTWGDARASIELLTALYHSAATGSDVSLPIGSDHPRYASLHEISA